MYKYACIETEHIFNANTNPQGIHEYPNRLAREKIGTETNATFAVIFNFAHRRCGVNCLGTVQRNVDADTRK